MKIVSKTKPKRCSHCQCELPNDLLKIIECKESKDKCTFYDDVQYYNKHGEFSPDFLKALDEIVKETPTNNQSNAKDIQLVLQQLKRDYSSRISRLEYDKQNLQTTINNYNDKIKNLHSQVNSLNSKINSNKETEDRFNISAVVIVIGLILALINLFYSNWFCRIVIPLDFGVWVFLMANDDAREKVIEMFE